MTANHPAITDNFAAWLSVFYAAHFLVLGISMPFFPVWLAAKGLDPGAIGLVLAAPMLGIPYRTFQNIEAGRGFPYPQLLRIAMKAVSIEQESTQ